MNVDKESTFSSIIEDHLDLKRRNSRLDSSMPLDGYRVQDPCENHPLFKSEEQARIEDTLSGAEPEIDPTKVLAWPVDSENGNGNGNGQKDPEDTLWGRSRDFDWGD